MAIRPIMPVAFNNNQHQINFQRKKKNSDNVERSFDEYSRQPKVQFPSTVKAATLAMALALNPMMSVAQSTSEVTMNVQKERYTVNEKDKLIGYVDVPDSITKVIPGRPKAAQVLFFDSDGNNTTCEKVQVCLIPAVSGKNIRVVNLTGFKIDDENYDNCSLRGFVEHVNPKSKGRITTGNMGVNRKVYNYLSNLLDNALPVEKAQKESKSGVVSTSKSFETWMLEQPDDFFKN